MSDSALQEFVIPGTPRGSEAVLVVEDEETVRRLVESVLKMHGYVVFAASSAQEALELADDAELRVDLLLTDLNMPDMSGRELARRICAERDGVRLLYMSGHDEDGVLGHGVIPGGGLFLEKPFTPYGLAWRVRDVLDEPRSAQPAG